ncbi:hypothetical protein J2X31_000950 [Flavobacterium arsenatis]|uniref:Uncharacterized protein n=1 Tax=Flavobacterium arsenatis TaxID=1484332 RepID=A0ABU1TLY3_9FLAO|nr:hypothetical protein [Flavobacterium arsenatis]MDR6966950.1 hypothetical protein [Flavobacterium arsenatis]
MKNIFVALALFFALGASAQVKKTPVKSSPAKVTPAKELTTLEVAEKDFKALNEVVSITNESTKANLIKTFETKHRELKNDLSQDRKDAVNQFITARLEELLGTADFAKLKANTKLFNKLTK